MDCRGKMWIIPETEDTIKTFETEIPRGLFHTNYFQAFSDMYHLGYNYTIMDYQKAPCEMALLGNLVVKTDEDEKALICYIPNNISDNQMTFINNRLVDIVKDYKSVLAYSDIEDYIYDGNHLHSIEEIKEECRKKYKTVEGENNVR